MVTSFDRFKNKEDGALLVFFAMCCVAIFLIAALSFDLGRRASTQTELQSFVDNVALAAAGELDGTAGSRDRARTAAANLISDSFVFGTETDEELGRTLSGASDYNLYFYSTLPDDDEDPLTARVLDDNVNGDLLARFVHVTLNPEFSDPDRRVTVPWVFANLLGVFNLEGDLPEEEVTAEAVAGFTALGCGQAPVFFCMPSDGNGPSDWSPQQHIGDTILLRASSGNSWSPGNFGWLDVESMIGPDALTDTGSPCYGITGEAELYNCLIAAEGLLTLCFESGTVDLLTGNRNGISPAGFNTRFDMFNATAQHYEGTTIWTPAPIVTKNYERGSTCSNEPSVFVDDAMDFPPDDCFTGTPNAECETYDGLVRYGNGTWHNGRLEYVDRNYAMDTEFGVWNSDDITAGGDIITVNDREYHIADPFRPEADPTNPLDAAYLDPSDPLQILPAYTKLVTVHPELQGFPVVLSGESRWDYYQAEVEAAYSGATTIDLIQDFEFDDPDNPGGALLTHDRTGSSLPYCSTPIDPRPERRLITAAVIDCEAQASNMNGRREDVIVSHWVEIFLTSVFGGTTTPGSNDIYAEIVSSSEDGNQSAGAFRDMIQLYR